MNGKNIVLSSSQMHSNANLLEQMTRFLNSSSQNIAFTRTQPIISYVASRIEPTAAEAARRRGLQDTMVLHQGPKGAEGPGPERCMPSYRVEAAPVSTMANLPNAPTGKERVTIMRGRSRHNDAG